MVCTCRKFCSKESSRESPRYEPIGGKSFKDAETTPHGLELNDEWDGDRDDINDDDDDLEAYIQGAKPNATRATTTKKVREEDDDEDPFGSTKNIGRTSRNIL